MRGAPTLDVGGVPVGWVQQNRGKPPHRELLTAGHAHVEGRGAVRGAPTLDVGGVPVGWVQQIAHRNPRDEGRFVTVDHTDGHGAVPPADDGGDHEVADG